VAELRRNTENNPAYPPVVFAFRGTPAEGMRFFDKRWPSARAIADHDGSLYGHFGLRRATLAQAFGPPVFRRAMEAVRRGVGVGLPGRDILRMPGLFLIRKPAILAERRFSHIGDHPDFTELANWPNTFAQS
jgi:hypothetical protein